MSTRTIEVSLAEPVFKLNNPADVRVAARILHRRLMLVPRYVLMDHAGNLRTHPPWGLLPPQCESWVIGFYNSGASVDDVEADLMHEMERRGVLP